MAPSATRNEEISLVAMIARDVLRAGIPARLPTTVQYQERLGVGSGTVQKAFKELRDSGAVDLVSRGHQGTFIVAQNLPRLWDAARLDPIHILLPPYGSREAMAVANGMASLFADALGAATTIGYRRGARARLSALDDGTADIALMSSGAAHLLSDQPQYVQVVLGQGTYYAPGSLVTVRKADLGQRVTRIGIDTHSTDHVRLTYAVFPEQSHTFVETDFTIIPRAVLQGDIDAGIWHVVDTLIPLDLVGLSLIQPVSPAASELIGEISEAVLVAKANSIVASLVMRFDLRDLQAACSLSLTGNGEMASGLRVMLPGAS